MRLQPTEQTDEFFIMVRVERIGTESERPQYVARVKRELELQFGTTIKSVKEV